MRSLLARIFLSFWMMIVITIASAAALGFYYSDRARSAIESFELPDAMLDAGAALQADGRDGLEDWLDSMPGITRSFIWVVDEQGEDILDRRLPAPVAIALRRFRDGRGRGDRRDSGNVRPARPFTELVGPSGTVYTIFVLSGERNIGQWLANRSLTTLAALAFLVSAGVSLLLARTISRPVERLRDSASAIAQGKLDTRVPAPISRRKDEIGLLAQEFDRMASELQRALERQTELTANVSHELRSPLARLRVALELARRKAGDLKEFEKMDDETERLDALIGQILEFSRLDAKSSEERSPLNLTDLVHAVVDDVRFEFGDAVNVTLTVPDDAIPCVAFENAVRACISNVLRNAAVHGTKGGHVQVDVIREAGNAIITVQDDGGGVDPKDLERLFEPFFRTSTPDDDGARQGTGLGLAIASRAATRNGGSIEAGNQNGGLLVTIQLPAGPN